MADQTPPDPSTPDPPDTGATPDWALNLQRSLEELPGKLKASVTDEDKSSIAEKVHGLFERSGAFETEAPKPDAPEGDEEVVPEDDPAPRKPSGWRGFAAKHFGDK